MKKNTENQMVAMVSFSDLSCGGCENLNRDCIDDPIGGFGASINVSDVPALAAELEAVLRRYESNNMLELARAAEKRRELERWANDVCSWAKHTNLFEEADTVYCGNRTRVYGWVGDREQELFVGEANCDKEDNFSPSIGKAIAIYRLMKAAGTSSYLTFRCPPKDSGVDDNPSGYDWGNDDWNN